MKQKIIPLVFSTNNEYMPYLGAALASLIEHATEKNEYQIFILHTDLNNNNQSRLKRMGKDNIKIECIDVSNKLLGHCFYGRTTTETRHITQETLYRIFIPEILPQFDKIIYLDCDLVLLRDAADLLEEELHGNILGAVFSVVFWTDFCKGKKPKQEEEYFNAGVLVMNLKQMRRNKIQEKVLNLLDGGEKFPFMDQDLLRIVCNGKVQYLDNRWNLAWHYALNNGEELVDSNYDAFADAMKSPFIIHYTSPIKPWNRPDEVLADRFWHYARKTEFYEEILYQNAPQKIDKEQNLFDSYIFPFQQVNKGSNIILYGAGGVGRAFDKQIKLTDYCNIILWVDKNYEALQKRGMKIAAPKDLLKLSYDAVVIAIEKENTAEKIREDLIKLGIDDRKIIWINPLF